MIEVHATAGTVMFLPRGHWHEVHSLSSTWSVNLVIKGVTWAAALADTLLQRLHRQPAFRAYCDQLPYGDERATAEEQAKSSRHFDALIQAASVELGRVGKVELSLAGTAARYRWAPGAAAREIVIQDGVSILVANDKNETAIELDEETQVPVRALLPVRGTFSWADFLALVPQYQATELYNLLMDLLKEGLLVNA